MKSTFFSTVLLISLALASMVGAHNPAQVARRRHHARKAASAAVAAAEAMNKPDAGPPASDFEADSSFPISKIAAAALKLKKGSKTYPVDAGSKVHSTIYTDWNTGKPGSAVVFTADMDVDCDGIDSNCKNNPDGQHQTDYGALAAYEVPWVVIPESFVNANVKEIPGNNIAAVICGDKMFYGIFGDSNGDSPEVIGEASWLMAQTCFPTEGLNGNNGHGPADVTYIIFMGKDAVLPSSALTSNYVTSFSTLKSMGNNLMTELLKNIGLSASSGSSPEPSGSATKKSTATEAETKTSEKETKTTSSKKAAKTGSSDLSNGSSGGKCERD